MRPKRLYLVHFLMSLLPPTRAFALKALLLRWAGATVGRDVRIVSSARFYLTGNLLIGDDTWIGHEVLVVGGQADVRIGARVDIAPRVTLVTGTHEISSDSDRAAGRGTSHPIDIGDGVWIGAGSTILGGTRIGECGVVAAGAVVTRNTSSRSIVGGVPAKVLRPLQYNDE